MRNPKILRLAMHTALGLTLTLLAAPSWAKEGGSEGSGLTSKMPLLHTNMPKGPEKTGSEKNEDAHTKDEDNNSGDGSGSVTSDPPPLS